MARPKSNKPTKEKLNLTVLKETKLQLAYLAQLNQTSISEYIADFAAKEARRAARKNGHTLPSADQITIDQVFDDIRDAE